MRPVPLALWNRWLSLGLTLVSVATLACRGQSSLFDSSFVVGAGAQSEGGYSAVHSILVQSNGCLLVGGRFDSIAGNSCSNLARLSRDGSYDAAFVAGTDQAVYRLLQQPNGRILVAGSFTNLQGAVRHKIGRLLPGGEIDPDFDAGSLLEAHDLSIALGLQPDGKVLVATIAYPHGRLFRLHSNGALDGAFVQTNLFLNWHVNTIHVRTNGAILVGGGFGAAGGHVSPGLALLDSAGRVDTNFNSQLNLSTIFTIQEQPNGRLLVGGRFQRLGSTNNIALARMNANLDWDDSFSADEVAHPGGYPLVRAVVEQPDGKLVVAGSFLTVGGYWRRNVARLDAQGSVDSCFDPGLGLTEQYFQGGITLVRQANGSILVGGYFDSVDGHPISNIARLLPESDCNVARIHFGKSSGEGYYVAGTSPPGGISFLEVSTNLLDWVDLYDVFPYNFPSEAEDYYEPSGSFFSHLLRGPLHPPVYFRLRKLFDFPKPSGAILPSR